ncbi:MAG: tetratricopeptide repeat protein [Gemmatimonadetes bacterium]|jgi:tetratricopeptide (TPR) repeat protein|nr:tetratricopeptide repeat protein [Gemmatimonadota bacterium]
MILNLLVMGAIGLAATMSTRYFSPQELLDRFEKGQRVYALGDYTKAVDHYHAIIATQSNVTIDVEQVAVNVDEFILPIRVAATYQLANAHNKLGLEKLERSEILRHEKNEVLAQERYEEALQDLDISHDYFSQLANNESVGVRTRVMAQFQMLETAYQLKRYKQVVEQGQAFLGTFPNSVYESSVNYNMAWSSFELEQYPEAIGYYEQVLFLSPRGSNSDRALVQMAACYRRLGNFDAALASLDRLIARYDFSEMSEQELIEMASLKLKGIITETTRELVASAQLTKGDILAEQGQVDEALAVYAVVPERYEAEARLVQAAYIRQAELIHKERGTEAAIVAYKGAIEDVDDKVFQAQAQLTLAALLFDEARFVEAGDEYGIYLLAYSNVAARIGFRRDKALFRIGQCHQAHGQQIRPDDPEASRSSFMQSLEQYRLMIAEHEQSTLVADALFGIGISSQGLEDRAAARVAYEELLERFPDHQIAPRAWAQLARMDYEEGDLERARDIYQSILDGDGDAGQRNSIRMELGITHRRLGDAAAAIKAFAAVDPSFPHWSKTQIELAQLYSSVGEVDRAQQVLDLTQEKVGDGALSGRLRHMKGKLLYDERRFPQAIEEFGLSLNQAQDPDIVTSSLFSRGASYYELARVQDAAGDSNVARVNYEASMTDMQALLQKDIPANMRDGAFRTLGAVMIRLDLARDASQYYQELIDGSDDPQEGATFLMLLTELYYDMRDFAQAETVARRLLTHEFEDDNSAGYYRRERAYSIIGNALLEQKKHLAAADIFAQGLERYPSSGESANMAFSVALARFSGGEYESALEGFKSYLEGFPNDHNRIHGEYYLAHSHQVLTQFEDAAREFAELADRHPDSNYDEEALFLAGENHYNLRDFASSAAAYQKLLAKYPTGRHAGPATYALAWSFFEQEMMEEGVGAMRTLVRDYPESEFAAKAQFTVGDFHYNLREYEQALGAYSHLLDQYADSEEAPRARTLVAELNEIGATFEYATIMKLFEDQQYDEAITGFEQITLKYAGTYTELAAYCNQGLAYEITRRWKQAADSYEQVLEKGGDDLQSADVVSFAKSHRDWIVENRL